MKFEEELTIKASPEAIYKLITKSTDLVKMLSDIKIKVLEKNLEEDYQITEWQLETDKDIFNWRQRENFDPQLLTINYSLIKGDFQSFDARWKIIPNGEETDLVFQAEVELESQSLIKDYIAWPFARKKMHQFCKDIINAVKDRLELELNHG